MIMFAPRYVANWFAFKRITKWDILQFEEYISAALSSVKYRDFVSKGENGGVMITGGTGMPLLALAGLLACHHTLKQNPFLRGTSEFNGRFQPSMDLGIQENQCLWSMGANDRSSFIWHCRTEVSPEDFVIYHYLSIFLIRIEQTPL